MNHDHTLRLHSGEPTKFNGDLDGDKALLWLSEINTAIELQVEVNVGRVITDRHKVLLASSYLDGPARRQYNARVLAEGNFETFAAFNAWIRQHYVPPDLTASYRYKFLALQQHQGETPRAYYLHFMEAVHRLDHPPDESWQCTIFVRGLLRQYRDTLSYYPDMSTFEGVTVTGLLE